MLPLLQYSSGRDLKYHRLCAPSLHTAEPEPTEYRDMKTLILQLSMVCAAAVFRVASPLVITGGCRSDDECITNKGENWCCARWNLGSGIAVCKPRGRMDDECHISSNLMPYPLDAPRAFWRCPCGPDLFCTATDTAKIGHCTTTFDNIVMKIGADME